MEQTQTTVQHRNCKKKKKKKKKSNNRKDMIMFAFNHCVPCHWLVHESYWRIVDLYWPGLCLLCHCHLATHLLGQRSLTFLRVWFPHAVDQKTGTHISSSREQVCCRECVRETFYFLYTVHCALSLFFFPSFYFFQLIAMCPGKRSENSFCTSGLVCGCLITPLQARYYFIKQGGIWYHCVMEKRGS